VDRLVSNGEVAFGIFDEPVLDVGPESYDLRNHMGRPIRGGARRRAYNQFQFLGAMNDQVIVGAAIARLGWVAAGFAYAFDLETGEETHVGAKLPLSMGIATSTRPEDGDGSFRAPGLSIVFRRGDGGPVAEVRSKRLQLDMRFLDDACEPMRLCTRVGIHRWVFARKSGGFPAEVHVEQGGSRRELSGALGHQDWTAGFMRRNTWWHWACFNGRLDDGRKLGLNAACGVNETSFSENCVWLEGKRIPLPPLHFAHDRLNPSGPWRVTSADGAVDLQFTPRGQHAERVDAGLVASNFVQLMGRYRGIVRVGGETLRFDGIPGYAETHYARW